MVILPSIVKPVLERKYDLVVCRAGRSKAAYQVSALKCPSTMSGVSTYVDATAILQQ